MSLLSDLSGYSLSEQEFTDFINGKKTNRIINNKWKVQEDSKPRLIWAWISQREDQKREAALAKEQVRINKKEAKRQEMMNRQSYRLMASTAKYMDKYFLDPILGFVLPAGIGDALSSVLAFPFVYYSLCVVKSIPLDIGCHI